MVDNAGYGLFAMTEEVSEQQVRDHRLRRAVATPPTGAAARRARSAGLPAYDGVRQAVAVFWSGWTHGDPLATAPAVLRVVDAEEPPLRVFLGAGLLEAMRTEYARRVAVREAATGLTM